MNPTPAPKAKSLMRNRVINKGVLYEKAIYTAFKQATAGYITVHPTGGHQPDLPFTHPCHSAILAAEIKNSSRDTMGGTSLRFTNTLSPIPVAPVEAFETVFPSIEERITVPLLRYIERANELITELNAGSSGYSGSPQHDQITGFPAKIPVVVRRQLVNEGYQSKIQSFYTFNLDSWKQFYRTKGSSYLQIGDKGFFHFGENPLNLPIPEINGNLSLEVRLGAAGTGGKPFARVEIRMFFKGLTCDASPYTLDSVDHIKALFMPNLPQNPKSLSPSWQ